MLEDLRYHRWLPPQLGLLHLAELGDHDLEGAHLRRLSPSRVRVASAGAQLPADPRRCPFSSLTVARGAQALGQCPDCPLYRCLPRRPPVAALAAVPVPTSAVRACRSLPYSCTVLDLLLLFRALAYISSYFAEWCFSSSERKWACRERGLSERRSGRVVRQHHVSGRGPRSTLCSGHRLRGPY